MLLLRPLLLGLLLLAALSGHCRADSGKRLAAALRPRRGLEQLNRVWWVVGSLQHHWAFLCP